ncbi:MAG: Gfo/Idh/MocA family oxidoreductase [Anaerolineae bacterium]|nr:Gfo/Idh/MocA family oxidoreductase [Anaerolineae bacterium]
MLRLGILGYDHPHAYRVHKWGLQQVAHQVRVVAIADPDAGRVQADVAAYGARYFRDYQDLLAWDQVDAVLITTVNALHARQAREAAQAGKHVLCEKPVCLDLEEGMAAVEACRQAGVVFATAFPVRHAPEAQQARARIAQGALGELWAINATNHGNAYAAAGTPDWVWDPARSGGGSVADHTVHCADLIRWFTGSEVAEVYAETATLFRPGLPVEDAGLLHLRLELGVIASIDASWSRLPNYPGWGDLTMHCTGSRGSLFLEFGGEVVRLFGDDPARRSLPCGPNPYAAMFLDFARAVREGTAPLATGYDGVKASEMFLAAYESVRVGKPVSLPL